MSPNPLNPQKLCLTTLLLLIIIVTTAITFTVAVTWLEYETRLTTYGDFDGLPSITQTSDGKTWVVWVRKIGSSYTIVYETSIDAGASWSSVTMLTPSPYIDVGPSIFQAMDNTIWVVWSSTRTGGYDLYYKTSSDNGLSWSNDTRLTTDPNLDKLPSITQTGDGKIWVVWCSNRPGNYEVFHKTYNGTSWSNDSQLTTASKIDMDPFILQSFDGKIWVFWSSRAASETGQDDLYYKTSSDNGFTWSNRIQFTTDNCDDMWSSVCQTDDWKMWVVWTSNRGDQPDGNWDIYYKTSIVGDVDGDNDVDIFDLSRVAQAYGTFEGEPGYDPGADITNDGIVDMRDVALVSINYGST